MSDKLPVISGKELVALLEKLGFVIIRILTAGSPQFPFIKMKLSPKAYYVKLSGKIWF
jgi:hypothetical protein